MGINFLAVVICAIVAMIVGMIWHSKALFGDKYMRAIGADTNISPEKMKEIQKKMWQIFLTQFLLSVFQVWILGQYLYAAATSIPLITNALWIWAGFIMPTIAGSAMWSARPRKMAWNIFLISAGYQLVLFVLFALILKAWM